MVQVESVLLHRALTCVCLGFSVSFMLCVCMCMCACACICVYVLVYIKKKWKSRRNSQLPGHQGTQGGFESFYSLTDPLYSYHTTSWIIYYCYKLIHKLWILA